MKIWVDIDNAPHVQLFRPIIGRLRELGADVLVTARDRTYVPQLLHANHVPHVVIGRGQPSRTLTKAAALTSRAARLAAFASGKHFDVAVGHGSRALPIAARLTSVRNLTMFDYEHVSTWLYRRFCDRILVPRVTLDALNGSRGGAAGLREPWVAFDGFKEEIYLGDFAPEPGLRARLGITPSEVMVVVRPPSLTAHYHNRRSEAILAALTSRLLAAQGVRAVWLQRDPGDPVPSVDGSANVIVPHRPQDGPSLLAAADVAISGGGTMNREAALLGTPAYSIFTGPEGALDAELIRTGRLTPIRDPADVESIALRKKTSDSAGRPHDTRLREFVVEQIWDLARGPARARRRRGSGLETAPSPERGG